MVIDEKIHQDDEKLTIKFSLKSVTEQGKLSPIF